MKNFIAFSVIFLVLGTLASAFSLQASPDYVVLHGTEARVLAYATSDASVNGNVYFSVDRGELNAVVEKPVSTIAPGESKGTYVVLNAPDNFRGVEDVTITAQLVAGGRTVYSSRTIRVVVYPTEQSDAYVEGTPVDSNYVAGGSQKSVLFTSYVDPTEYRVSVLGGEKPVKVAPGEFKRIPFKLLNYGAAGTFELKAFGGELNAFMSRDEVSLQRNEAVDVYLDVKPYKTIADGRYFAKIQVVAQDRVVFDKDVAFDVADSHIVRLIVPASISGDDSKPVGFEAAVQNLGSGEETLSITTNEAARAPATVKVGAGEIRKFVVLVDTLKLAPGENTVLVKAENAHVEGTGEVTVNVESKQVDLKPIPVTVAVKNDGDTPLENVTGSVSNIPSTWLVMKGDPITVPAHSESNLTLYIRPMSREDAEPILTIKSGDTVLERVKLPAIRASASGLSGFFVAMTGNSAYVAGIVLVAVFVALMVSRARMVEQREARMKRLHAYREEVKN